MKSKGIFGALALLVIGIVFGAILVSGFGLVRPGYADINLGAPAAPVRLDADASSFGKAFIETARQVTPEIVEISVVSKIKDNPHDNFFFFPFKVPEEEKGTGSGIIISKDGYIITNNHVVENATKVTVRLFDKRTFDAKVVGTDPLTDLAVVKIDADNLPVAYLGNSDSLKVGQWVMAIGNPLSLSSTVTAGIVSAINRGSLGLINNSYGVEDFIQTDAAINPGNSGGALVDLTGAVIGVNSAIASGRTGSYIGYGFAIPINLVRSVAKDLIAHGKVSRGYIGINISSVDYAMAKSLGLSKPEGIIVQDLVAGGAAKNAGIKTGDVILKADGKPVNQPNELQSYIATKSAGETVTLTIWRDGKSIDKKVTLKARDTENNSEPVVNKENENNNKKESSSETASFDKIGFTVQNMNQDEKDQYNTKYGVLVTDVQQYSEAEDHQLQKGIIILEADNQKIHNVDELKSILNSKKGGAVLLRIADSKGQQRFVGIEIPD
jgi:Do/DeqQ family serine protease